MAIQRFIIFLLMPIVALGALGDQELTVDGAKLIWNNNSQTFSIAASGSMSASVDYIWPVADATADGQALLSNSSAVLRWGVPTTSAAHNILSATHDATANAVTRGSIIYGNSTPKWDELTIGAANTFLKSDGTDVTWSTLTVSSPATLTGATIGWDSTLIDATTWSDGSNASNIWTFDVSGTDHTMTASSAKMAFSNEVEAEQLSSTDDATIADNTNTGSLYAGVAGDRVEVDSVGDVDFIGQSGLAFGELSVESNAVQTTISTEDVPVQVTVFDTARHSNNTILSIANSDITILQAGHYLVTVSATVNSVVGLGSKAELKCRVNNGSFDAIPHADRDLGGGASESGSITLSGIADLEVNDTLEMWIINETNTANYVVEDISMAIVQIGGPNPENLLLETGDILLLETGDNVLLESFK